MSMLNPFAYKAPESLYIHVPFCERKCKYCDFYSQVPEIGLEELYLKSLLREIRLSKRCYLQKKQEPQSAHPLLRTIYFGGGTPSLLSLSSLEQILELIGEEFQIAENAEITLEANPSSALEDKLIRYRELGINRLSLGLQTTHDELLAALGRLHSYADFRRAYQSARSAGFANISVDLIFGLPGEDLNLFQEDLRRVLSLEPEHISFYSLILEPETPLARELGQDPGALPTEYEERAMYHLIPKMLREQGYLLYEISNAAKPGYEAVHNSIYWQAEPYFAVGPAASSYVLGERRTRIPDVKKWANIICDLSSRLQESDEWEDFPDTFYSDYELIEGPAARDEYFLLGFRTARGVSLAEYAHIFSETVPQRYQESLDRLIERGLILEHDGSYRLSKLGLDLANQVFLEFV